MENENVNIDGAKEANKRSFEVLDELFAYPEEKQDDLDVAKKFMGEFLDRVYVEMEDQGIDIHELSKKVNEDPEHLEDVLDGEVFIEWVLFCKLAYHLDIDTSCLNHSPDH